MEAEEANSFPQGGVFLVRGFPGHKELLAGREAREVVDLREVAVNKVLL